jgi:hypothetical protein
MVTETDLEKTVRPLGEIRKVYKHNIKVVNPEDIQKAIQEKNTNVLYMHKVGPEGSRLQWRVWKMIWAWRRSALLLQHAHHHQSQGDGFLSKDFAKITSRAILKVFYYRRRKYLSAVILQLKI